VLNLWRVGHCGDDLLSRFNGIMLVRLDLRKFVEHSLRKFALFEIEDTIISEYEPPSRLLVGFFVVEVFRALLGIFDLPEHDDRTFLTLAGRVHSVR
jgi:hypothetical protein